MNEQDFSRLMEGVKQGAEYLKGLRKPSRVRKVTVRVPDVNTIPETLSASSVEIEEPKEE